jgi:hypothetical protein
MKQIVKSNSNIPFILVEEIINDHNLSEHGLYAIIAKGHKYVLSATGGFFTFASGNYRWSSRTSFITSFITLLRECVEHPDIQVFIFDDLKEYAEWILKD